MSSAARGATWCQAEGCREATSEGSSAPAEQNPEQCASDFAWPVRRVQSFPSGGSGSRAQRRFKSRVQDSFETGADVSLDLLRRVASSRNHIHSHPVHFKAPLLM